MVNVHEEINLALEGVNLHAVQCVVVQVKRTDTALEEGFIRSLSKGFH